jgi:hypothetical protein
MNSLKNKRIAITIGATVAIVAVWLALIYLPLTTKVNSLKDKCALLNDELTGSRSGIGDIRELHVRVDSQNQKLSAVLDLLGTTDSIPNFIQILTEDMKEYGLKNIRIIPNLKDLIEEEGIALGDRNVNRVEFKLTADGRYLSIGRYLEYLQKQPYYFGQTALDIFHNQYLAPRVELRYAFYILLENRG